MSCPDTSTLRAWIDAEPSGHHSVVADHLAGCAECRQSAADQRRTMELASSRLAVLTPPAPPTSTDVETALARASRRIAASAPHPVPAGPPTGGRARRWSWRPVAGAAALALAFVLVGTPTGRSAASSFLAGFRSESFVPVAVDPEQGQAVLADLAHLGRLTGARGAEPVPVASVAAAARRVGFPLQQPDPGRLPNGVRAKPEAYVLDARQLRFTFDRRKATAWMERTGQESAASLPARFDGASLVVSVPAAAVLAYPASNGAPAVVVGQARPIEAHAEGGVSLAEMRRFLLALPGLSDGTRRQLAAVEDWRTALPLPIPADQLSWRHETVDGADALVLDAGTGLGSAALWQRDDRIYGVAATAGDEVVRDVAASLH